MGLPQPNSGVDAALHRECGAFSWTDVEPLLAGGGINLAHQMVDRHVAEGNGQRMALRWRGRRHQRHDYTYAQLADLAGRAAQVLLDCGIGRGDVVSVLLPRSPEFFISALAIWKIGAVFNPLCGAFGPGPLRSRLELGGAKALIAREALYSRKIAAHRSGLDKLAAILLVGDDGDVVDLPDDCRDFRAALAGAAPADTAGVEPTTAALLHFTSGTAGTPKGALHSHGIVLSQIVTGRQVFDLVPDDVYWCTADPGWVTATTYGMIMPLALGACVVMDEADFDPKRWYALLRDEGVTVWYTTPTAIRLMMRSGTALARSYREFSLRVAASIGEPLNAEAVAWGEKAFGVPFFDTWWQTETGAIAIANRSGAVRPGSMGKPLPGVEAAVLCRATGTVETMADDKVGELALKASLPSLFSDYLGNQSLYQSCFVNGWYFTGDLVRRDADGYFWFIGRCDDMIKCAAHSIGPFEVEAALMNHPAVAEVAVIGKPDQILREVPVAFITLNPGFEPGEALRLELLTFARQQLGRTMAPQEVHFVETLPKTTTGKIVRRLLKSRVQGGEDEAAVANLHACPGRFDDE